MKFIFICRGDPWETPAGTEIFVGNLAVELAKQGHEIDLVYEEKSTVGRSLLRIENLTKDGFRLLQIPYFRSFEFRKKCSKRCHDLLADPNIAAVIAFGAGTFSGDIFDRLRASKSKSKALLVYYAMDSMVMEYARSKGAARASGLLTRLKMWLWYRTLTRVDKASCIKSDLILASSKDTAAHLVSDYDIQPSKIKLLYEGIPDDFADCIDVVDPDVPTFLHVAGGPRKGTDLFLKAVRMLEDNYGLKARAVIIRASQSDLERSRVLDVDAKGYGYISTSELKHLYGSCTAFVSPSLSEGFCLPIIEAAMFEKPLIVTNVGSLPELVTDGENGFVIPVEDVNTLVDRMHQIAINTELRKKMGKNARKRAENFTINNTSSKLLTIIKEFNIDVLS